MGENEYLCFYCGEDISVALWKDYAYIEATGRTYAITVDVNIIEQGAELVYDVTPVATLVANKGCADKGYHLASSGGNTIFFGDIMPKVGAYCKCCGQALGGILR